MNQNCLKKTFLVFIIIVYTNPAFSQVRASMSTGISLLRNFSPQQKFWAFGQAVQGDIHFSPVNTLYTSFNYHLAASFNNRFTAVATDPLTVPLTRTYNVRGRWSLRHFSLGWKRFLKGSFEEEQHQNFYVAAGFGLYSIRAENTFSFMPDTSMYFIGEGPRPGSGTFNRLTFDLSAGTEFPVAPGFFIYTDLRTSLSASSYPEPLLHRNERVPFPLMLHAGLRILMGFSD